MLAQLPQTGIVTNSLISSVAPTPVAAQTYTLSTPLVSQSLVPAPQIQIANVNPVNYDASVIAQAVPGTVQLGAYDLGAYQTVQYPTANLVPGYQLQTSLQPVTTYKSVVNYKPVVKTGYVPQVQTKYVPVLDSGVPGSVNPGLAAANYITPQPLALSQTLPLTTSVQAPAVAMTPQPLAMVATPMPMAVNTSGVLANSLIY